MTGLRFRRDAGLGGLSFAGAVAGPSLAALVAAGVAIAAAALGAGYDIVLLFGINAIMAIGFQLFVGNTGIMSFGHVAFMGIGAYAAGILALPVLLKHVFLPDLPGFLSGYSIPMLPSLLAAGLIAAAFALVAGSIVLRLTGSAASISTFALLIIVNQLLGNATSLTRGEQTFSGVPATTNEAWVFGSLIVVAAIAALVKWSRVGLRARAVRDDPVAAQTCGLRVLPPRVVMFAISAFITGVGGALYAHFLTAFSPSSFYIDGVVTIVVMSILGGLDSVTGAVVGAAVLSVLLEVLRHIESGVNLGLFRVPAIPDLSTLVLGVGLVALLRWRPAGLAGAFELQVTSGTTPRQRPPEPVRRNDASDTTTRVRQ